MDSPKNKVLSTFHLLRIAMADIKGKRYTDFSTCQWWCVCLVPLQKWKHAMLESVAVNNVG